MPPKMTTSVPSAQPACFVAVRMFFQYSSMFLAPGKMQAMPMIAMSTGAVRFSWVISRESRTWAEPEQMPSSHGVPEGAALFAHAQLRQRVVQIVVSPVDEASQLRKRNDPVKVAEEGCQIAEHGVVQMRSMRKILVEGRCCSVFVESGHSQPEVGQLLRIDVMVIEQRRQFLGRVELPHAYRIFHDYAFAIHTQSARFPRDGGHIQIQGGR